MKKSDEFYYLLGVKSKKRIIKNITYKMKNNKKSLGNQAKIVKRSFSGNDLTHYSGLSSIGKFINRQGIAERIKNIFPTQWYNSTLFGLNQILLLLIFASLCGIKRLNKIAAFSHDGLLRTLLNLNKGISPDTISLALKKLGQSGARTLQSLLLDLNRKWLIKSTLTSITIDCDSTVKSVCGNQEGAAKGYNTTKKGAKSYHPLLAFCSNTKQLYHSWFRTGSAYTSNGICDFVKEIKTSLPETISKVFFRADSGFFSGNLFDLLESNNWDYLVKVKFKGLDKFLENQQWTVIDEKNDIAICKFDYQCKGWKKSRTLKAIRTVKEYIWVEYFGQKKKMPVYQYACYVSNRNQNGWELHKCYTQRSVSETWIEQLKSQVMAGGTLTNSFWANDILWQLATFAYNISVMMRSKSRKYHRQEHRTFIDWFISVPGKIVSSGRQIELKMYEQYFFRDDWIELDTLIECI